MSIEEVKFAFPTDEQHPFADHRARSVALQMVEDLDPDIMSAGSDALDFYGVSTFQKDLSIWDGNMDDEIEEWKKSQREWLDAAPNANILFLEGNHEERFRKYILANATKLSWLDALTIPEVLKFKELGIRMARNNEIVIGGGRLLAKHGKYVRKHSGYTAKAELEELRYSMSVLTGHTHRGGTSYAATRDGWVVAHESFCLCSLNPPYMRSPNWQNGIVFATVGKTVAIESIPFTHRGGKVYGVWRVKEYESE